MTGAVLAVTTAADATDLVDVATVKAELGLTGGGDDALLGRYVTAASAQIGDWCDRVFAAETVTETWRDRRGHHVRRDGVGSHDPAPLRLRRRPVSAIASVTVDGTALDTDEWELDAEAGLLWRLDDDGRRLVWCGTVIAVAYTGGYALPDAAPAALADACIALVKLRWFGRLRDPRLKAEETAGIGRDEYWVGGVGQDGSLPPEVAAQLASFRDIPV